MSDPLRVAIVEDEAVIARRIARLVTEILGPRLGALSVAATYDDALPLLAAGPDLLILDLALGGDDGFALLRRAAAGPFDTIVVSAHAERALEAFEYGVRDFVAKPFGKERLARALDRVLLPAARSERPIELVGVRTRDGVDFVPVRDIVYIRGAGTRCELVLRDGRSRLHDKLLDRLEHALPAAFQRVHKSYIVDLRQVARMVSAAGARHALILRDGTRIPVGRTRVGAVRARLA